MRTYDAWRDDASQMRSGNTERRDEHVQQRSDAVEKMNERNDWSKTPEVVEEERFVFILFIRFGRVCIYRRERGREEGERDFLSYTDVHVYV